MFIIKYHAKGHQTEYFSGNGRVKSKRFAMAFGENLRGKFSCMESEHCALVSIDVSPVAELMYADRFVKYNKIDF